jgi:bacterioferritin-associated ferredoxin
MFVCVCHAVTDTEVTRAIEGGASTREQVTRACGAGGDCGACHEHIEDMIGDHQDALVAASELVRKPVAA